MPQNMIDAAQAIKNAEANRLTTEKVLTHILDTVTAVSKNGGRIAGQSYCARTVTQVDFGSVQSELAARGFTFEVKKTMDHMHTMTRW